MVSLPARGAWIEIVPLYAIEDASELSLPARGAWIEIDFKFRYCSGGMSLPARGAWIEMTGCTTCKAKSTNVAPRTGSVD